MATRYAGLSERPDVLALSHLDQIQNAPAPRVATAYRYAGSDPDVGRYVEVEDGLIVGLRPSPIPEDLTYQERLTHIVQARASRSIARYPLTLPGRWRHSRRHWACPLA